MPEIERAAEGDGPIGEAELAAAAFLVRCQRRTLEAYLADLRGDSPVGADARLDILEAPLPQVRSPRAWLHGGNVVCPFVP